MQAMISSKKLLALILAMAIATTILAFFASAEEAEAARHAMASPAVVSSAMVEAGQDDDADVVALPWRRRVLRHRGRKEHGGGGGGGDGDGDDDFDWRTWHIPPSGPSSRGHVAVDVDSPEEEKKTTATAAEGGGGSGSRSSSSVP